MKELATPSPVQTRADNAQNANIPLLQRISVTVNEAAELLGISTVSLWRLEKRGILKPVRLFRTKLYEVEALKRLITTGGKLS